MGSLEPLNFIREIYNPDSNGRILSPEPNGGLAFLNNLCIKYYFFHNKSPELPDPWTQRTHQGKLLISYVYGIKY